MEEDQSDCSEEVVGEGDEAEVMQDLLMALQRRTMSQGFASLDCVNLEEVFQVRVLVTKTVPMFMRGAESWSGGDQKGPVDGKRRGVDQRMEIVSIVAADDCCSDHREEASFHDAGWRNVWHNSSGDAMNGITATERKRRRCKNDMECRTAKAFHLTQSARHVLESSPVDPGDEATKKILTDDARRPSKPRSELDPGIAGLDLEVPFDLDVDKFLHNLRTARKGCAGGFSGMMAEHLKVGLESPVLVGEVACQFARARMPAEVVQAIRLGRITALQKPDGGVRGIVVGDVFRRLIARTMAQQFSKFAEGTHPFQCAPSTRKH